MPQDSKPKKADDRLYREGLPQAEEPGDAPLKPGQRYHYERATYEPGGAPASISATRRMMPTDAEKWRTEVAATKAQKDDEDARTWEAMQDLQKQNYAIALGAMMTGNPAIGLGLSGGLNAGNLYTGKLQEGYGYQQGAEQGAASGSAAGDTVAAMLPKQEPADREPASAPKFVNNTGLFREAK